MAAGLAAGGRGLGTECKRRPRQRGRRAHSPIPARSCAGRPLSLGGCVRPEPLHSVQRVCSCCTMPGPSWRMCICTPLPRQVRHSWRCPEREPVPLQVSHTRLRVSASFLEGGRREGQA
jgi:hypothetical protein